MSKKLMRKKLAMMLATLKKKRKFFCEVEYLESTGTQYIDVPYIPKNTSGLRIVWSYANNNDAVMAGARKSTSYDNRWFIGHYSQGLYFGWNTIISTTATSIDTFYDCRLNLYNDRKAYINGEEKATISTTLTTTDMAQTKLFWTINAANKAVGKLKLCQITEGNKLICDFIPVLDWDMTPCMYDRVTEQLFYNAGTGDFVAGREIHPVEYLESTGTQYIDTGYKPNNNTKVECKLYNPTDFNTSKPGSILFGARNSGNIPTFTVIGNILERYGTRWDYGSNTLEKFEYPLTVGEHTIVKDKQYNYLDGILVATNATSTFNVNFTMHIFGTNTAGTNTLKFVGRFYYFKIWDNDTLVRDFIPSIDENGVGFMFDQVTHTIYDNAGNGNFAYPPVELEYIESTGTQYIDTGYVPTNTTGVEVKHTICADNGIDNMVFGCRQSSDNTRFWEDVDWSVSDSIGWGFNTYSNQGVGIRYPINAGMVGQAIVSSMNFMNDRACKVNGVSYDTSIATKTLETITRSIYLFAANNQGYVGYRNACKIFTLQISNEQELVRDFVPVFKDGQRGMLDKLTGTLYTNQASGDDFSVGKIVEPEYE